MNGKEEVKLEALEKMLRADTEMMLSRVLNRALDKAMPDIVRVLEDRLGKTISSAVAEERESESEEYQWRGIESLSRMRAIVGGRYALIKERWLKAGFPLKEHKGESGTLFEINESGWCELSDWIVKQGFELRLLSDNLKYFFEVRKLRQ